MDELSVREKDNITLVSESLTMEDRLEIIEEGIRKNI